MSKKCSNCSSNNATHLTGTGWLCDKCFQRQYATCNVCGRTHRINLMRDARINGKDVKICSMCFSNRFVVCDDCGMVYERDSIEHKSFVFISKENKKICKKCFDSNYTKCAECGEYVHKGNTNKIDNGNLICNKCLKDNYIRCASCNNLIRKSVDKKFYFENNPSRQICYSCHITRNVIHEYGYKPDPKFVISDDENKKNIYNSSKIRPIYLGVEIEFQCSENSKYQESKKYKNVFLDSRAQVAEFIENNLNTLFYQKRDGSIGYGIEMVSHPLTLEAWYENSDEITNNFNKMTEMGCKSLDAKSCGMHVHISKNNYNHDNCLALLYFINKNKANITQIAGRESNSYSKYRSVGKHNQENNFETLDYLNDGSRYNAINLNNYKTIEYRIFQSVLDPLLFYKNLEFCHSSYRYVQLLSFADLISNKCWQNYIDFINSSPEYSLISAYINNEYKF